MSEYISVARSLYEHRFQTAMALLSSLKHWLKYWQTNHVVPLLYESSMPLLLTNPSSIQTIPYHKKHAFLLQCRRMILPSCLPPEILCCCKHIFIDRWSVITAFYPELLSFPIFHKQNRLYSLSTYFQTYLDTHQYHFQKLIMTRDKDEKHHRQWLQSMSAIYSYIYAYHYIQLLHPFCLDMTPVFEQWIFLRPEKWWTIDLSDSVMSSGDDHLLFTDSTSSSSLSPSSRKIRTSMSSGLNTSVPGA